VIEGEALAAPVRLKANLQRNLIDTSRG